MFGTKRGHAFFFFCHIVGCEECFAYCAIFGSRVISVNFVCQFSLVRACARHVILSEWSSSDIML